MKNLIGIVVVSLIFLGACSTRKNTFVSRGYHNVSTKYNVLYNGNVALEKGIQELNTKYEDNFWEVLPIEPLKIEEEIILLPGKSVEKTSSSFDIAEEKAVKAVQKHGMYISGSERNKQIDDAYLLLGKSRYYSQRFVPAIEAFEYVLKHYPKGDLNKELRIWKAKTQIRLQNEEQAVFALKNLLKSKKLEKNIKEEAHTALAMAFLALDSVPQAIEQLNKAVETHENKEQHARNLFVLGQLYRQEQNLDSSQLAFQQILSFKKSPYKYRIHTYIEQVKNATDTTDVTDLQKRITKLIKERENRPYLDELYYQTAQMNYHDKDSSKALENLINSTHTPLAKNFQKGLSYEKIGDHYFDKAKFVKAGAYYDSVMPNVTNQNTKRIRRLKRKRKSLDEVIVHENTLKYNDSILSLVAMNTAERTAYFNEYVAKIKKADELAAILKENKERSSTSGNALAGNKKQNKNAGKWYFYNTQTVGFGKAEFQKMWGNRKLQDNWRWSERSVIQMNDEKLAENTLLTTDIVDESKKYDVDYYINRIPKEETELQLMHENNSNALYQLGLIYKEKFQQYPLAIKRLERFLAEKPKENLILPAKYHLYKIYEITEDSRLEKVKIEIITDYPDSRFTKIIQNPNELNYNLLTDTPESHYEKVYCDYEYEKYAEVLAQCNEAIKQYEDNPIQAKFELLKSYTLLKTENKASFVKGLEFVVDNYPKTLESEHAQEVLDIMNGVKKQTPILEKTQKKIEEKPTEKQTKNKLKPLTDQEKKEKVLELMKKKGSPIK